MRIRLVCCLPIMLQQLSSCSSYHHATTIVLQQVASCNNYFPIIAIITQQTGKKTHNRVWNFNSCCLPSITFGRPFVVVAYCLQRMQTICGCYLPFAITLPSMQILNLTSTSLLLPSSGKYLHVAEVILYSKNK